MQKITGQKIAGQKIAEFTLNRQICMILDLVILREQRNQRHTKLDKFLTEYFLQQNLRARIIHQSGKKAQLFLQACSQENKPLTWQAYNLHISYSLPLVAVSWARSSPENSAQAIGIDLAQEADFVMQNADWQALQYLYFSPNLPFFQTPATRCQAWCALESQHKCCEIALQEYSPERDFLFSHLGVNSQSFDFYGQNYWLSVCKINYPH